MTVVAYPGHVTRPNDDDQEQPGEETEPGSERGQADPWILPDLPADLWRLPDLPADPWSDPPEETRTEAVYPAPWSPDLDDDEDSLGSQGRTSEGRRSAKYRT